MNSPGWNEWDFWLKDPESIRNLAFTAGSIAAVIGGTIGIILATIRSLALRKQANAAHETQITQLFTQAVEFLGSDKPAIRLGAVYSLERIAQTSSYDYLRCLEVIYSFIRQTAVSLMSDNGGSNESEPIVRKIPHAHQAIPADLQGALDVIARNKPPRFRLRKRHGRLTLANIDLHDVDLRNARLPRAYMCNANLSGADLSGAMLTEANLENAKLVGAVLSSADLNRADLTGADLSNCKLDGANLRAAKLNRAILVNADTDRYKLPRSQT